MPRTLAIPLLLIVLALASCGGDDGDDRSQIEDVTEEFFEGLVEGDCDQISDALALEEQIPEGQCRDFIASLEDRFADAVSSSFGGGLDEFELGLEDVRSIDVEGEEATAAVVVHLTFGSDGDLSDVFGIEGADGEISGEVNIPSGFSYVKQDGDWKVAEAFESPDGQAETAAP
jgi:hypothetical protein